MPARGPLSDSKRFDTLAYKAFAALWGLWSRDVSAPRMEEVQRVLERAIGLIGDVAESGMKLKDDTEAYQRPWLLLHVQACASRRLSTLPRRCLHDQELGTGTP